MSTRRHAAASPVLASKKSQQGHTLELNVASHADSPRQHQLESTSLRMLLPMAYLPFMCIVAATDSVWAIIPLYLHSTFNMTRSEISATMSLRSIGKTFASTPGGWANSMTGLKVGMLMAFLIIFTSFMSMAFAATSAAFHGSLVLLGVGEEWYQLGLHTFLAMNVSPSVRGRSMGVLGLCKSVAGVSGPVLFAGIATAVSSQGNISVLSMAAAVVVATALHLCCVPSVMGRVLKRKEDRKKHDERGGLICQTLRKHGMDLLRVVPFLCGLRAVRQGNYMLNALICLSSGYELSDISLVTSSLLASVGISAQFGACLMDKFSPKLNAKLGLSIMMASHLVIAVGLLLPSCWDPTTGHMYLGLHLAAVIVFGIGQGLMQGTFTVISANKVTKEFRSVFLGLLKTSSALAGILSVLMVGYFDSQSTSEGSSTAAFCLVACSAVSLLWVQCLLGDVSRKKFKTPRKKTKTLPAAASSSDDEEQETTPMISNILPGPRTLVRSVSFSALEEIRYSMHTDEDGDRKEDEDEQFWIQLEEPFFELRSNIDEDSFNKFRRNYLQYRAGASHGAQGEVSEAV